MPTFCSINKVENVINQIEGLIYFSEGKISEQEALSISEKRLRLTDFSDDSPLAHKGPRWFAKRVVKSMKMI